MDRARFLPLDAGRLLTSYRQWAFRLADRVVEPVVSDEVYERVERPGDAVFIITRRVDHQVWSRLGVRP